MIYITIELDCYMIIGWIIIRIYVLVCVKCYSNTRGDTAIAHPASITTYAGTLILQNKNNSIGSLQISTSQEYVEFKIKRLSQAYTVIIPDRPLLITYRLGKCITMAIILCGTPI